MTQRKASRPCLGRNGDSNPPHSAAVSVSYTKKRPPSHGGAANLKKKLARLPAIVRESLVGLGHPVGVFLLLDGVALAL